MTRNAHSSKSTPEYLDLFYMVAYDPPHPGTGYSYGRDMAHG